MAFSQFAFITAIALTAACTTLNQKSSTPTEQPTPDPETQDPLVDPEIMTDRPIESTTLEPDPPAKPSKSKKKTPPKKKK